MRPNIYINLNIDRRKYSCADNRSFILQRILSFKSVVQYLNHLLDIMENLYFLSPLSTCTASRSTTCTLQLFFGLIVIKLTQKCAMNRKINRYVEIFHINITINERFVLRFSFQFIELFILQLMVTSVDRLIIDFINDTS